MDDSCTILDCDIISRDHLECTLTRIEPRNQLLISYTGKLRTLHRTFKNLERNELVARLVILEFQISCLRVEMCIHKSLCNNIKSRLPCIWIE